MEQNQRLKTAIIEVVNNQMESDDPPETNLTLARLIAEGYSTQAAKELIGNVVVAEVFEVLSQGEPFDLKRYIEALNNLPEFPE